MFHFDSDPLSLQKKRSHQRTGTCGNWNAFHIHRWPDVVSATANYGRNSCRLSLSLSLSLSREMSRRNEPKKKEKKNEQKKIERRSTPATETRPRISRSLGNRMKESVCVCVCVCEREREREREMIDIVGSCASVPSRRPCPVRVSDFPFFFCLFVFFFSRPLQLSLLTPPFCAWPTKNLTLPNLT